ncbi:MAG: single-stranded-DNA-specific exonuclease RecJ [Candidatus Kuenenbacteria bacterium]
MGKKWKIKPVCTQEFSEKFPEINGVVLQLLYNRGLKTQNEIDQFLGPDYLKDQHDPFLFNDMDKATARILESISKEERIVVYGDYDVDGVTSCSLLYNTLKRAGANYLGVYIPDRMKEGYGLNKEAIKDIANQGTKLVITVDCGISGKEEIDLAKELGMDVIVTDHHQEPAELPDKTYAIICPTLKKEKYPFADLAGVGVAFKLAQALLRKDEKQDNTAYEKWLLDLVALGTVADCVPLLGENRTLVKWGLLVINKTQRLGLQELITASSIYKEIDTRTIGFQIAPRINAAGRMDHANTAFELLTTDDEAESLAIAIDLNQKNKNRQKATEEMMKISLEQIGEPNEQDKILFSCYDGWSAGLVGLVAGKLADQFSRPVIVFGKMGDKYVGSGRSIPEFDITAALGKYSDLLKDFGGHAQACGLTVVGEKNYIKFIDKMRKIAGEKLAKVVLAPHIDIEAEINLNEANWELVDELDKFEPFGEGNEKPFFVSRNLMVVDIATMGAQNQHARLLLKGDAKEPKKFVAFNMTGELIGKIKIDNKVDAVFEILINEWNGNREIEFKVKDIKLIE